MSPLTDNQFWSGMAVTVLCIILIAAGYLWHWRKIDKDILREDRRRLTEWAHRYAEQLAQEMFREYIRGMQINFKPTLINESDINWGDGKDDAA